MAGKPHTAVRVTVITTIIIIPSEAQPPERHCVGYILDTCQSLQCHKSQLGRATSCPNTPLDPIPSSTPIPQ